jgi:HEAT repeat protein
MLQTIDQISWSQLEHAYGPADDVPGLLRDLASPNVDMRQKAMHNLYGTIWHQGTVYEATAYTVPFLLELLQHPVVHDKDQILILLVHLANGNSYIDVHQHLGIFQQVHAEEMETSDWQAELERELSWVRGAHDAVGNGIPIYVDLLSTGEPAVRSAAAYVLAGFTSADTIVPLRLGERLATETHPLAKASLLLSLGTVANPEWGMRQLIEDQLRHESEPLIQLSAAMALTRLARDKTPLEAVKVLVGTIKDPQLVAAAYAQLPWADVHVVADVSAHLPALGEVDAPQLISLLVPALDAVDPYSALEIAATLLTLAFNTGPLPAAAAASDLTVAQRQVLDAIAASDTAWRFNVNLAGLLRSFGLPDWRDRLQSFLQKTAG